MVANGDPVAVISSDMEVSNELSSSGYFALMHAVDFPVLKIKGPVFIEELTLTSSKKCMPSIGFKIPPV